MTPPQAVFRPFTAPSGAVLRSPIETRTRMGFFTPAVGRAAGLRVPRKRG